MILNNLDRATRKEKMGQPTAPREEQFAESARLDASIARNLKELGYGE